MSCLSVVVYPSVDRDLANHLTDLVLHYSTASTPFTQVPPLAQLTSKQTQQQHYQNMNGFVIEKITPHT